LPTFYQEKVGKNIINVKTQVIETIHRKTQEYRIIQAPCSRPNDVQSGGFAQALATAGSNTHWVFALCQNKVAKRVKIAVWRSTKWQTIVGISVKQKSTILALANEKSTFCNSLSESASFLHQERDPL
jgi:hypothetical protein